MTFMVRFPRSRAVSRSRSGEGQRSAELRPPALPKRIGAANFPPSAVGAGRGSPRSKPGLKSPAVFLAAHSRALAARRTPPRHRVALASAGRGTRPSRRLVSGVDRRRMALSVQWNRRWARVAQCARAGWERHVGVSHRPRRGRGIITRAAIRSSPACFGSGDGVRARRRRPNEDPDHRRRRREREFPRRGRR